MYFHIYSIWLNIITVLHCSLSSLIEIGHVTIEKVFMTKVYNDNDENDQNDSNDRQQTYFKRYM